VFVDSTADPRAIEGVEGRRTSDRADFLDELYADRWRTVAIHLEWHVWRSGDFLMVGTIRCHHPQPAPELSQSNERRLWLRRCTVGGGAPAGRNSPQGRTQRKARLIDDRGRFVFMFDAHQFGRSSLHIHSPTWGEAIWPADADKPAT